jgi:hypothetical protein
VASLINGPHLEGLARSWCVDHASTQTLGGLPSRCEPALVACREHKTSHEPPSLLFHGGSGHKRTDRHLRMGRWLASAGLAVIAIDGPYHGSRVSAPMAPSVYQQLIADEGIEPVTARLTTDWLEALSALARPGARGRRARQRLRDVDGCPVRAAASRARRLRPGALPRAME